MARAKKVDRNHKEIVDLFRELGAAVADTSAAGAGFPDLVVQFRSGHTKYRIQTHLVEIKDGSLSPSRRRLTDRQEDFHAIFNCTIVECRADVFDLMGFADPDGKYAG